jgi:hypothetical protein
MQIYHHETRKCPSAFPVIDQFLWLSIRLKHPNWVAIYNAKGNILPSLLDVLSAEEAVRLCLADVSKVLGPVA